MRGPGLHVSPEIRRQWRCLACGRERLVGQTETTVICRCQDPPRFMQLVEGKRVVRPEPRPVSRFIEEDEMPPDEIDPNAPPVDPNVESVSPPPPRPPRPPRPDRDKESPREQVRPREQARPGEKGPPREQKRDRSGPPPHQKKPSHNRGEKRPTQTQPAEAISVPLTEVPPPASPPSSDAAGPSKKKRRRNRDRDRNRSENSAAPGADGSTVAPEQQTSSAPPIEEFGPASDP